MIPSSMPTSNLMIDIAELPFVSGYRAYVARVTDLTNKVDANRLCKDLVPLQEN